jgi:hypothetical protein
MCETWDVTVREEYRSSAVGNRVVRKILGERKMEKN